MLPVCFAQIVRQTSDEQTDEDIQPQLQAEHTNTSKPKALMTKLMKRINNTLAVLTTMATKVIIN